MELVLRCDCGFEACGRNRIELIEQIRAHARGAHGMTLSRDDAQRLADHAQAQQDLPSPERRHASTPDALPEKGL